MVSQCPIRTTLKFWTVLQALHHFDLTIATTCMQSTSKKLKIQGEVIISQTGVKKGTVELCAIKVLRKGWCFVCSIHNKKKLILAFEYFFFAKKDHFQIMNKSCKKCGSISHYSKNCMRYPFFYDQPWMHCNTKGNTLYHPSDLCRFSQSRYKTPPPRSSPVSSQGTDSLSNIFSKN